MHKKKHSGLEFFKALEDLSKQLGRSFEEVKSLLVNAFAKIIHDKYDPEAQLELEVDIENRNIRLINHNFEVVEDKFAISDEEQTMFINLKDAIAIKKDAKVGDTISCPISFNFFDQVEIRKVKQLLHQEVREIQREKVNSDYGHLVDTIVDVKAEFITSKAIVLSLIGDERHIRVMMPRNFQNPLIRIERGQVLKAYVEKIEAEDQGSHLIVSNSSPMIVRKALEIEVPEVADGTTEIVRMGRRAGIRTKIALRGHNPNVDAIASCLGRRGARINAVIERITPESTMHNREKIDIIRYSDDKIQLITNAMSPALVVGVKQTAENAYVVIVPNRQLSLAIGTRGSNVSLAGEIADVSLEVKSVGDAKAEGFTYEFNGNVPSDKLAGVERGERLNPNRPTREVISFDDFDDTLTAFHEEITNKPIVVNETFRESGPRRPRKMSPSPKPTNQPATQYPKPAPDLTKLDDFNLDDVDSQYEEFSEDLDLDIDTSSMFTEEELLAMEKQFTFDDFDIGPNKKDSKKSGDDE